MITFMRNPESRANPPRFLAERRFTATSRTASIGYRQAPWQVGRVRGARLHRSPGVEHAERGLYYRCRGADCGLRVGADEIEQAVIGRVQELATADGLLDRITEETNKRMARQRPTLLARRRSMQKGLQDVKAEADKVLAEWSALEAEAGRPFLADKLSELAQRRSDLERGVAEADEGLARLDKGQVTTEQIRDTLGRFGEVYACLTPFEKKELVRLVLHGAEVGDRQIVLELYPVQLRDVASPRPVTLNWLPEQDSNLQPSG